MRNAVDQVIADMLVAVHRHRSIPTADGIKCSEDDFYAPKGTQSSEEQFKVHQRAVAQSVRECALSEPRTAMRYEDLHDRETALLAQAVVKFYRSDR